MTNMTDSERSSKIKKALKALDGMDGQYPRVEVRWNNASIIVSVITLPLEAVVLNPRSHRIKAELEGLKEAKALISEPFSESSQALISTLLRKTEDFESLKADLQENGQLDYGTITSAGVLINANTRAVALRDLGEEYIKVAVLPSDDDEVRLEDLEAFLQLRVERKQPYSFPNELLFIEDMKKRGKSDQDIALQLGYAVNSDPKEIAKGVKKVKQHIRLLALARDIIKVSKNAIPLTYFAGRNQAIQEIDQQYEEMKNSDNSLAHRVRAARILGLLADLGYRELRLIDSTFLDEYLLPGLQENELLADVAIALSAPVATSEDEDLALFEAGQVVSGALDVTKLLDGFAKTYGNDKVILPGASTAVSRDDALAAVASVLGAGVEDYRSNKQADDRVGQPAALLAAVAKSIKKARAIVVEVKEDPEFNGSAVRDKITSVQRALKALEAVLPQDTSTSN